MNARGFSLQIILGGLIVLAIGLLIAGLWVRAERWEKKFHIEFAAHAETLSRHNIAVANAAMETARAERMERDHEQAKQTAANEARSKDAAQEAFWKSRVNELGGELSGRERTRRKQLLDHIARLTDYISTGAAGKDPTTAVVDIQNRLTTCGQFLGRADDVAERASVRYGEVRNLWDECVRDAKAVRVEGATQMNPEEEKMR